MRSVVLAGLAFLVCARDDFAIARDREADGNTYGAAVAARRGRIERDRADNDVMAADRNRFFGRVTEY